MTRLSLAIATLVLTVLSTACNKTELMEPQTVGPVENATPVADDRLGPCGQLEGTVYERECGWVLESDNGKVYALDASLGFEAGQELSYQIQGPTVNNWTECSEIETVIFSCLEQI